MIQPLGRFSVMVNETITGAYDVHVHTRWSHIEQSAEVVYPNLTFNSAMERAEEELGRWAEIQDREHTRVLSRQFEQRSIFDE